MDKGILAAKELRARRRIQTACEALAERFGLDAPELPTQGNHPMAPLINAMKQKENIADFLEQLVTETAPKKRASKKDDD